MRHVDSKLLFELADERIFGPFAGMNLAAWELPQASHFLVDWPLCKKHAPVGVDEGAGGDKNERLGVHHLSMIC